MNPKLRNLLIGCAVVFATFVIVGVGSCIGFAVWLNRPGKLVQPETLMSPDTSAMVTCTVKSDDAGVRQLYERFMVAIQRQQERGAPAPGWLQSWMRIVQNAGRSRQIDALLPITFVWTVRPGEEPESDLQLVTLSLPRLGNRLVIINKIVGWVMGGRPDLRRETYGRATLYTTSSPGRPDFTFFFQGSNISFASDAATARAAIDRLAQAPSAVPTAAPEGDLATLYRGIDKTRLLRGAFLNSHGEIVRLLKRFMPEGVDVDTMEPRWAVLQELTLSGAFEGEDQKDFSITLEAVGPDETWARANAEALARDCEALFAPTGIDGPFEARQEARRVLLSARIEDPAAQIERHLEQRERERQERAH